MRDKAHKHRRTKLHTNTHTRCGFIALVRGRIRCGVHHWVIEHIRKITTHGRRVKRNELDRLMPSDMHQSTYHSLFGVGGDTIVMKYRPKHALRVCPTAFLQCQALQGRRARNVCHGLLLMSLLLSTIASFCAVFAAVLPVYKSHINTVA
jgi:hypothetical protein